MDKCGYINSGSSIVIVINMTVNPKIRPPVYFHLLIYFMLFNGAVSNGTTMLDDEMMNLKEFDRKKQSWPN
jgi:hypothetical protein